MAQMKTYVINLERSPERRDHICAELRNARMGYEIVPGVDGRELDLHDVATVDPALFARSEFPAGMAGCALSHLRVYRKILADGVDAAVVLEDDVDLSPDLGELAEAVASRLTGAELALLNYDSKEPIGMSRDNSLALPGSRLLAMPLDVRRPGSSAGYVITREACARMVEMVLPVRASPDDWWFFYRAGALDRVRCVVPMPVRKSPQFGSTIGQYGLGNGLKGRMLAPLVRNRVAPIHQLIALRRERIHRRYTRLELVDHPFVEKPSWLD
jgi:glycosyl transferase family 25